MKIIFPSLHSDEEFYTIYLTDFLIQTNLREAIHLNELNSV